MENCYIENDFLVCFCGKCKPEDYELPSDFVKKPSQIFDTPQATGFDKAYIKGKKEAKNKVLL